MTRAKQKFYNVALDRWKDYPDGGGRNFEQVNSLRHAIQIIKRNPKYGQIDVRYRNPKNRLQRPYCCMYWDHGRIIKQEQPK